MCRAIERDVVDFLCLVLDFEGVKFAVWDDAPVSVAGEQCSLIIKDCCITVLITVL